MYFLFYADYTPLYIGYVFFMSENLIHVKVQLFLRLKLCNLDVQQENEKKQI